MTPAPHLAALARSVVGDPEAALVQVLRLLCEQLGMTRAVLGRISGGVHTVHLAVDVSTGRAPDLERAQPAVESWCAHVPPDRPLVVADVAERPDLAALPPGRAGLQCYVGTVVRGVDGRELGVLGVCGTAPHTTLNPRDLAVLEALSEVVGELYPAFLRGPVPRVPSPRSAAGLGAVADAVSGARDLEGLTRPLLEALHEVSGIASTYLTVIDEEGGSQEIRFARNARPGFAIPEGLQVPWEDTLCKRALDEGRSCTTDVPGVWGDSHAGRDLGIVTYVSVPVRLADGSVWGTLCGADAVAHPDAGDHVSTLTLFARLIATEVERSAVVERERAVAARVRREAETDVLTGCTSRRGVDPWLHAALDACGPGDVVAVAYVDVDAFKPVNDGLGHATGDAVLSRLGRRLLTTAREGDLVARLGGDEFVVAARLPAGAAPSLLARVRSASRFALPCAGGTLQVRCSVGVATTGDVAGGPDALLAAADAAMYRDKAAAR